MKYVVVFLAIVMSGCATVNPSFVRDGKQVYEATCNGTARSIADCHKLAAQQCGGSYKEMSIDGSTSGMMNVGNGDYAAMIKRSLLFTCTTETQAKTQ